MASSRDSESADSGGRESVIREGSWVIEEYKKWMESTPLLYDRVISHTLEWPSLTVQWLPERIEPTGNNFSIQKLILGTHTSDDEPNYLILAEVHIPLEDSKQYKDQVVFGGFGAANRKVHISQQINHDGEVNRARYMPQNTFLIATKAVNAEVYVFDYSKHPCTAPQQGRCNPDLRLQGHQEEGFGLSWSSLKEGHLLSGSYDKRICLWNVCAKPKGQSVLDAMQIYECHSEAVEDVAWHLRHEYLFGSVGDDCKLLIWDTRRSAILPVNSVKPHTAQATGKESVLSCWKPPPKCRKLCFHVA